jgi:hypothetical protein
MSESNKDVGILVRYIRDYESRKPVCVMVGVDFKTDNDGFSVGYSFIIPKGSFSKKQAREIAKQRAIFNAVVDKVPNRKIKVPVGIDDKFGLILKRVNLADVFPEMLSRFNETCNKYFKKNV